VKLASGQGVLAESIFGGLPSRTASLHVSVKNSRDPDQIIWPGETNRAYRSPVADILREALQIHKANKVSAELHSTNVENWTSVEN